MEWSSWILGVWGECIVKHQRLRGKRHTQGRALTKCLLNASGM